MSKSAVIEWLKDDGDRVSWFTDSNGVRRKIKVIANGAGYIVLPTTEELKEMNRAKEKRTVNLILGR